MKRLLIEGVRNRPAWALHAATMAAALYVAIVHSGVAWLAVLGVAACAGLWAALATARAREVRELSDHAAQLAAGGEPGHDARHGTGEADTVSAAIEKLAGAMQKLRDERARAEAALRASEERSRSAAESVELRLRTSEERFRMFMSANPAACWIVDEHGRFAYANQVLADMLDSTESALAGQSVLDLLPREHAQAFDEKNRQVLREGKAVESLERGPRRDGSVGDFAAFRFPLRDTTGRDVVGGMAFDMTERTRMADALRSSEERFREFMDNNPALCWICDESGRITYVNKTYVGSQKLSLDPVGRHPIELFPTAAARSHVHGVKVTLEKARSIETQEQWLRADGSNGDFTVFRFPLVNVEGRRSVGGVAIDITDRLRAAGELKAANVRLQALSNRIIEVQESERRQLARELHDEIGQCLTALKINLEGLQRTAKEPATLARIAESVELSAHTLAQVRRLSVDLRPSQLDDLGLEPALRSILDRQASTGGFAGHYSARLDGVKLSDQVETACFRVCQEALTNIIKHAKARNVWVSVEKEGDRLSLRVRDDGLGFDPAGGRQRAVSGQSFGLLGMQERASLAGGHLEIDSAPGRGAEVRAWFAIGTATTDGRP